MVKTDAERETTGLPVGSGRVDIRKMSGMLRKHKLGRLIGEGRKRKS